MREQNILAGLFLNKDSNQGNQVKREKILFYLLLIISFITVLIIYLKADLPYDTGDGIVHYQIARYSWKYPHLLLDLWGKPFFTLISSPFAQFGFKGMYLFQTLNAAVISWFLFSMASKINLKYAWTIPAFVFFAPIYFTVMNSGLVEVCFGMIFMFSVWLVFNKKYYASALVASLLPFVRPEAYVVMPLLFVIYAYRRKFFAIPLLLTAAIIYSLIGYSYFKDILWIINQNYKLVGVSYPGMKGSYFHYFGFYNQIWGSVYTVLLLLGIGIILSQVYRLFHRKSEHEFVEEVFILFLGSTVGCFTLHSLLYGMPGILNNLGMLRYLAVIIPSSAFIALIGLNMINLSAFTKINFLKPAIVILVVILVIGSSFSQRYYPFRPNNEQLVMKQMATYIQTNRPNFKKMFFWHPLLPFLAELDPYEIKRVEMLWSADQEYLNQLPDSTLILWDSHFMKGEGKIPFNWLSENPNFIMLKHYIFSDENFPFEACLFIRAANPKPVPLPVEIVSPDGNVIRNYPTVSLVYTFANDSLDFIEWFAHRTSFSGRNAVAFTPEMERGPFFQKKIRDISQYKNVKSVTLKFNLHQADSIKGFVSVVQINDNDKQVIWEGLIVKQSIIPNQWNTIELQHSFPEAIKNEDFLVNIYIWNNRKRQFYINDFQITFESILDEDAIAHKAIN
jgi:hypothetical protein